MTTTGHAENVLFERPTIVLLAAMVQYRQRGGRTQIAKE